MTNWDEVIAAAEILRDSAAEIDLRVAKTNPNDVTLSELARALLVLQDASSIVRNALGQVSDWTCLLMEANDVVVPEVAHVHRDWKKTRTAWRNDELRRDVFRALKNRVPPHAVEPDTGERIHDWDQAIAAVTDVFNLAGYNARVAKLKALGIETRDYCEEGAWRSTAEALPISRVEVGSDDDREEGPE
jgi:hypothetical protein